MNELADSNFVSQWLAAERDTHRRLLSQLKREMIEARRGSDRSYRPVVRQGRG